MDSDNKLIRFLENNLMGPMGKIANLRFVRAIMAAGVGSIPFIIVGSMFLVLNILPEAFPFLQGFFENTLFRFSDLYMLANRASMGILALYFTLIIGYEYTRIFANEEKLDLTPLNGALLSLFAFVMTVPQLIFEDGVISLVNQIDENTTIAHGWEIIEDGVSRFGATGLFSAIIMAFIAVRLYRMCVKQNWVIKMPDSVPSGVSKSFTALIPAFVVAFAVIILNGLLVLLGTDVFQIVAIPFGFVVNLTDSWIGILIIYFLIHAVWLVGIHGSNIIYGGILLPIVLTNMQSNIEGANIPLAGEFQNAFAIIGGSGATLVAAIIIAFLSKSEHMKTLGKTALIPSFFNINEPLIFGIPIIYNPYLAIPFFLAPMVSASIAYWAIELQIIAPIVAHMPWPAPVGLGAFISTGGDLMAAVIAIICALVAGLIWYPFIKLYDNRLLKQEQEEAAKNGSEEESGTENTA